MKTYFSLGVLDKHNKFIIETKLKFILDLANIRKYWW